MSKKKKTLTDELINGLWGLIVIFLIFASIAQSTSEWQFTDQVFKLFFGSIVIFALIIIISVIRYNFGSNSKQTNTNREFRQVDERQIRNEDTRIALNKYRRVYGIPEDTDVYLNAGVFSTYSVEMTRHELEIVGKLVDNDLFNPNCIFLDTYLKTKSGKTIQIDIIAVGKRGIFVFESKDYSGWIFGNGNSNQWTQTIYHEKHHFYNPVKQNSNHIATLKSAIGVKAPYHSLIVFGSGATLKDISYIPKDTYVITNNRLVEALCDINSQPECLTTQEVLKVCKLIHEKRLVPDDDIRNGHIEKIKDATGENRIYSQDDDISRVIDYFQNQSQLYLELTFSKIIEFASFFFDFIIVD